MAGTKSGLAGRVRTQPLGIAPTGYRAPDLRPGTIRRDDLVKRLLGAAAERIVVVAAPGGYGKTTTMRLWQDLDPRGFAWVNLDRLDNDPVHLLRHVALPLDEMAALAAATVHALTGPAMSPEHDMVPALVADIADIADGTEGAGRDAFVLVLDDVHVLTSDTALRCLSAIVAAVPVGSQVALVGRTTPAIGLSRLRLDRGALILDAGSLSMSEAEAAELLGRSDVVLGDDSLRSLVDATEGWPGGLHLAALAMTGADDDVDVADVFSGRNRLVADYLVEEVLAVLDADTVEFLERSAVLERMNADLLDDLLGTDDAGRMLDALDRSGNLFLVPLDDERDWYRYHHLFGDLLRARLARRDPAGARVLHRGASRLLEERGDVDAAVHHCIAAGDTGRAADLVLVQAPRLALGGRAATLSGWLDALGASAVEDHPAAAIAAAWTGVAHGDAALIDAALAAAQRSPWQGPLADGSASVAVAVAMVRAMIAMRGIGGVIEDTEVVRGAGGPATNPWWATASAIRATALSMRGEVEEARDQLHEVLPHLGDLGGFEAAAEAHLGVIDLDDGDVASAARHCTRALELADRYGLEAVLPAAAVFAAGSLVAAVQHRGAESARLAAVTGRMLDRIGSLSPRTALLCSVLLARAAVCAGDPTSARFHAERAELARRREPAALKLNAQLDEVHARLRAGSAAEVVEALTPAELRLLAYLPTHLSLQEIAAQLFISRNTAKTHTVAIYRKLGVSSRGDAVDTARRLGLAGPEAPITRSG